MVWQQLLKLKTIPPAVLVLFSNTNVLPSSSALSISPFITLVFVWDLWKKSYESKQILSNNRYCLINKPSSQLKEQTCMDLLPSWEQMKDGWHGIHTTERKGKKEEYRKRKPVSEQQDAMQMARVWAQQTEMQRSRGACNTVVSNQH